MDRRREVVLLCAAWTTFRLMSVRTTVCCCENGGNSPGAATVSTLVYFTTQLLCMRVCGRVQQRYCCVGVALCAVWANLPAYQYDRRQESRTIVFGRITLLLSCVKGGLVLRGQCCALAPVRPRYLTVGRLDIRITPQRLSYI